jgi:glucoamylase
VITLDSGVGVHYADLPTSALEHGENIVFTFYWHEAENWEGADFNLTIERSHQQHHVKEEQQKPADRDRIKVFLPS